MADDLIPCPFCGGEAELNDYTDKPIAAWVLSHKVSGCFLRFVERYPSREIAVAAWNRRAPIPAQEAAKVLLEDTPDYDAGLLNDFGGGDVDWWLDYIRAEIGRANEYWRTAIAGDSHE